MATTISITDDGGLQLNRDGVLFPPLTIKEVNALHAEVGDARAASNRAGLTRIMRGLVGVLAKTPGLCATLTIANDEAVAIVDATAYGYIRDLWDVTPDPVTGAMVTGPVTVLPQTVSTVFATVSTTWDVASL